MILHRKCFFLLFFKFISIDLHLIKLLPLKKYSYFFEKVNFCEEKIDFPFMLKVKKRRRESKISQINHIKSKNV